MNESINPALTRDSLNHYTLHVIFYNPVFCFVFICFLIIIFFNLCSFCCSSFTLLSCSPPLLYYSPSSYYMFFLSLLQCLSSIIFHSHPAIILLSSLLHSFKYICSYSFIKRNTIRIHLSAIQYQEMNNPKKMYFFRKLS